ITDTLAGLLGDLRGVAQRERDRADRQAQMCGDVLLADGHRIHYPAYAANSKNRWILIKPENWDDESVSNYASWLAGGRRRNSRVSLVFSSRRTLPLSDLRHYRATNTRCDRDSTL